MSTPKLTPDEIEFHCAQLGLVQEQLTKTEALLRLNTDNEKLLLFVVTHARFAREQLTSFIDDISGYCEVLEEPPCGTE